MERRFTGNGNNVSVRKTVKNNINTEQSFYRAAQPKGGAVKILPVSISLS